MKRRALQLPAMQAMKLKAGGVTPQVAKLGHGAPHGSPTAYIVGHAAEMVGQG